jgi:ATP-dependent DNA helicase RecQ
VYYNIGMSKDTILKEVFGYSSFKGDQDSIIDHIISDQGTDGTLVIMPTGGGKSLCYQIPCILSKSLNIIVSPLISLMKDQVDALKSKGIEADYINSNQSVEETKNVLRRVHKNELRIVYVAPERFNNSLFRGVIERKQVDIFAIDESHCISSWGNNFRPSYKKILEAIEWIKPRKIVALTATANSKVREDIKKSLGIEKCKTFCSGFNRDDLHIEIVRNKTRDDAVNRVLEEYDPDIGITTGIVYTSSRKESEYISSNLNRYNITSYCYHAGLTPDARNQIQENWMRYGGIIAATNAFGMGIDKSDVRFIVNYGIPSSIEEWYQEIGRGSRDGKGCNCILMDNGDNIRKFLIDIEYPSTKDLYYFGMWLVKVKNQGTLNMTQEKMGTAAGIKSSLSSGCVRFFLKQQWLEKTKNGRYTILKENINLSKLDFNDYNILRDTKYKELKELRDFIDNKKDKMNLFCNYFK